MFPKHDAEARCPRGSPAGDHDSRLDSRARSVPAALHLRGGRLRACDPRREAHVHGRDRLSPRRAPKGGAASLDLAWVACGVFDGFFELGLAPWDVAAGGLLIVEAGGLVTDWDGGLGYLSGDILAGSPAVHAELARIARRSGSAPASST